MRRLVLAVAVGLLCSFTFSASAQAKKKIIFIAGNPSHEWGGHEHNAGCELLAKCLNESMGDKIETKVYHNGWPKEAGALDGADAVIMYCDGGYGHVAISHLKALDDLAKKGVGVGCIHYAVEPGDGTKKLPSGERAPDGRAEFLTWMGGYYETFLSVNPHWTANITAIPTHPVGNGVKPFTTNDEWYYHMRFRPDMAGVTPIISAIPPDSTRKGKDDAHGGNAEVRAGLGKNLIEHMVWVSENKDAAYNGQRGFGCTGGHVHWNWAQDDFRKSILNAIVWIAKVDVPADGVASKRPTAEDMLANMDKKNRPKDRDDAWVTKFIEEVNKPAKAQ